ncbi:hypothetical protein PSECIP111854_03067 [Pseudoalteromonas sp. CIP111854]|uniref:Uncharacterized protein n=1 Tax=Pseudoalteromonas holothuriae TaxID=2963714 RepID=A0A9W4VTE8_9GAMM|nr:hypothetical protein [Pseudoalteromonas sp. CIP111854]CAH9062704.1 hypothetical protein PSECIP111854_03067 [Pseudoalteromonas sp. CIP111854]
MSDFDGNVNCDTHGNSNATFICQHLASGEGLGFNLGYDPDNPDELCPDAWCNKCEEVLDTEGEWNDKSEAFADIKVMCEHCYEEIRDKNWIQDDNVYHNLVTESFAFIEPRHKVFLEKYNVGAHSHDFDHRFSSALIT